MSTPFFPLSRTDRRRTAGPTRSGWLPIRRQPPRASRTYSGPRPTATQYSPPIGHLTVPTAPVDGGDATLPALAALGYNDPSAMGPTHPPARIILISDANQRGPIPGGPLDVNTPR